MDKEIFKIKLKNKEYEDCISLLRKELIEELVNKIKEKDEFFSFSTTKDLYNKSKMVLTENYSKIAYELYNFDVMDENEKYVLVEMLEMYKEIT